MFKTKGDMFIKKIILITGSTDGIGLVTAKKLVEQGHHVLLHGRSSVKLSKAGKTLSEIAGNGAVETYLADFSRMNDVEALVKAVINKHDKLDVLINNAGVLSIAEPLTQDGLDVRFVVNTLAPYLLTQGLLPLLGTKGRVINLSSAAQATVDLEALAGKIRLPDEMSAYAQSKLALTMWSCHMALLLNARGPMIVAVNPGSLLASKMVKEGFGVEGKDINIGANILIRAALSDEFATASGKYFDNDSGQFAVPHDDALDPLQNERVVRVIEGLLARLAP